MSSSTGEEEGKVCWMDVMNGVCELSAANKGHMRNQRFHTTWMTSATVLQPGARYEIFAGPWD